jgi:diguanylate cyclase (GGDEF)-like protein
VRASSLLRPRDERQAARVSTVLFLAGGFLLTVYLVVEPTPAATAGPAVTVPVLGGLLVFAALPHVIGSSRLTRWHVWPALPVVGVVTIGGLVLLYPDAENVAHPLLALPVLFAASQLRAPVSAAVTGTAIVVDGAFLLRTEERAEALTDLLFIGVVLVVMTVLLIRAVDGQERLVRALERQAAVDSLTGLVTRRVLDDALASALSASATHRGTALILIDVDRCKSINDGHGHPVGDDALVHLAGVLCGAVRVTDAVVSRLGGDELAVLLPGCSAEVAARRAEDLVAAVREAPLPLADGRCLPLTVSIGVAHAPDHAADMRGLYAAADAALYQAKRGGRNGFALAAVPGPGESVAARV